MPDLPTYADLVRRFGLAFRPGKRAYQYAGLVNAYPEDDVAAEVHDGVVRAAFVNFESGAVSAVDPYEAALNVWRSDGLLGANDLGPPGFREERQRYLAARAPADLDSNTVETLGRPRLPLQGLLDAVAVFQNETRRIVMGRSASSDDLTTRFNAERDQLIRWFAERGVDVDPTE